MWAFHTRTPASATYLAVAHMVLGIYESGVSLEFVRIIRRASPIASRATSKAAEVSVTSTIRACGGNRAGVVTVPLLHR